ncbi:TetR family transcriptional regulator [Prauserella shujinwangii]|uniref:TetR family transcriptional regulator n=1 Tax=Prauserella shujinwangii TaxID=1453103 RepID=A0A2T0LPL9_9PSEU|nr:TetR/AcrR family transcriptional regulator [Prauserella shujinwangii]PRX45144.1 TetR family transcriptional regulator [Prauserella shujinwangii]
MRINTGTFLRGSGMTPTEAARRAQIIEATIDTVAELGYGKASFARIVERAGLSSTRMISYHFAGKEDLMLATMGAVVDACDRFLEERLPADADRAAMLRARIEAEAAFVGAHPRAARALIEIGTHGRTEDGASLSELVSRDVRVGRLQRLLLQGQREGAFGEFDAEVMAMTIRHALDGVALRRTREPGLDVEAYGRELAGLFDRATRPG